MDRITAAGNLTIEMDDERWRLLTNGGGEERIMVEALTGRSLRYVPRFAQTRRLPGEGILPTSQVYRVVLGWSAQDEAWHLGLLLGPELAEVRGSRWCEVAHWPDPQQDVFQASAQRAGEALALVMGRPFYLVPPASSTTRTAPQAALPALPITCGEWSLAQTARGELQMERAPGWKSKLYRRAIWYTFWVVIYVALSVLSLTANIAPPNPPFLPLLGLLTAVILIGLVIRSIYQATMTTDRIVVDPLRRHIRGLAGARERWRFTAGDLRSVYVSQVVSKKRRDGKQSTFYDELNLHLKNGQFHYILDIEQTDEIRSLPEDLPEGDAVLSLDASNIHSNTQAAGVYIAQALGVLCWYDRRIQ